VTDPAAHSPSNKAEAAFDWCFRSREDGRITIAQLPNPALWIFLATVVLRRVVPDEQEGALEVLAWVGLAALAWWALDELIRGCNPWRRLLGVGGCIAVVLGVIARLS